MLNRIIDWAVANRLLVVIALVAMMAGAAFVIPTLNLDAFPDVTNVQVSVNTEAPGLAAEEVEQLITYPVEAVMYALPDVEEVRSISKTGLSGVTVVFKEGMDIYFARQLVFERLQAAKELIPDGVGTPEMGPNTSGLGQVYQYMLVAEPGAGFDAMELRSLNDWVVKLLLIPAEGVTDVLSFGGDVRQYQVNLHLWKIAQALSRFPGYRLFISVGGTSDYLRQSHLRQFEQALRAIGLEEKQYRLRARRRSDRKREWLWGLGEREFAMRLEEG